MPEITIHDATFARLQRHAKPLIDTPDSVVNRALDALERTATQIVPESGPVETECPSPLIDTSDSVVDPTLDAPGTAATQSDFRSGPLGTERLIDPWKPDDVTHTKVLEASISGRRLAKANWNALVDELLRLARKHVSSVEELRILCPANMVAGRKEDDGYSYLPDINLSVQGQDANAACRNSVAIAKEVGIELDVRFMWRHKRGAAHPGERGRLTIPGTKGAASPART